jgi:hypothetical protein
MDVMEIGIKIEDSSYQTTVKKFPGHIIGIFKSRNTNCIDASTS